jgi:hypothetical protein
MLERSSEDSSSSPSTDGVGDMKEDGLGGLDGARWGDSCRCGGGSFRGTWGGQQRGWTGLNLETASAKERSWHAYHDLEGGPRSVVTAIGGRLQLDGLSGTHKWERGTGGIFELLLGVNGHCHDRVKGLRHQFHPRMEWKRGGTSWGRQLMVTYHS